MASSSYNKFSVYLVLCHVAAFFFLYGITNNNIAMADTALIESVCKLFGNNYELLTSNIQFRPSTADLVGLGKISIEITIDQLHVAPCENPDKSW